MSMLRYFFEIGTDQTLFDNLYISQNQTLCETYMGKFPVIFISLKNVDGLAFEDAQYQLAELIGMEAEHFYFLSSSDRLSENEKERYHALISLSNGRYAMDNQVLTSSLQILSQLLCKYYGQRVIVLIDEYDVPLDKAFQHGYYKEMVSLIRGLFGKVLKTNDFLQFAVLTGCLRVSKESIFTGLNNFKVLSITDTRFDEQFGFTGEEVRTLLETYHLESHLDEIKEWFNHTFLSNAEPLSSLLNAFAEGDAAGIEQHLTQILSNTISIFDTRARNEEKEIFYHGILLGLLRCNPEWLVRSNAESGDGFADILIEPENPDLGIVIELKYTQTFSGLEKSCDKAIAQIEDRRYDESLRNEGRTDILAYGIAFCKKRCKVIVKRL